jgi:hypothetical protein
MYGVFVSDDEKSVNWRRRKRVRKLEEYKKAIFCCSTTALVWTTDREMKISLQENGSPAPT